MVPPEVAQGAGSSTTVQGQVVQGFSHEERSGPRFPRNGLLFQESQPQQFADVTQEGARRHRFRAGTGALLPVSLQQDGRDDARLRLYDGAEQAVMLGQRLEPVAQARLPHLLPHGGDVLRLQSLRPALLR